jgi:hypothetical protein
MTPTITQNLALYHLHRARNVNLKAALRFFKTRLKQLRRAARKQRIKLIWLRLKNIFLRALRVLRGGFLFLLGFAALCGLAFLLWINSRQ